MAQLVGVTVEHSDSTPAGELEALQRLLHARTEASFAAARDSGMPGRFETFEEHGLLAAMTTVPELAFLNAISLVADAAIASLPGLLERFRDAGVAAPTVVVPDGDPERAAHLRVLGLQPAGTRPCAGLRIRCVAASADAMQRNDVRAGQVHSAEDLETFRRVLLAGYAAPPMVERLIRIDHGASPINAYLAWIGGAPAGAAAMSRHSGGWVLGGAATLEGRRGRGVQAELLRVRLRDVAAGLPPEDEAGTLVAVTARADSPSARNLVRAGLTLYPRQAWRPKDSLR